MDESLGTRLEETKQRIITEIEHLVENEFYNSHYKQKKYDFRWKEHLS